MTATPTLDTAHRDGLDLVTVHTRRFVDYVRSLAPGDLDLPVPGGDWTVGQTVAHLESVYLRYSVDLRRSERRNDLIAQNDDDIAALGIDVDRATATMVDQVAFLASIIDSVPPDRQFPFHGGQQVTLAAGWGNLLGELLAHGDDIVRATGRPFTIPGRDLEILWRFTAQVLQGWLRDEADEVVETWHLRFPFGDVVLVLDHGTLRVATDSDLDVAEHHDLEIEDASEFTLAFPYRRRVITDAQIAILASRFHDL
ncbi:MAG: maleylpyruvate isomerase N-terminal domain-containing protein [Actinomycetota bacterium]|nr:maleylpyruvate isomerase N-terminal domain-containing protein [Actinomycetota bacterium]